MNAEERRVAHGAITWLHTDGLTIGQGWQLNGQPPSDIASYLDGIIESCFPTDEDELTQQVIAMIEDELQGG